jgi:hypothetical protein
MAQGSKAGKLEGIEDDGRGTEKESVKGGTKCARTILSFKFLILKV